MGFNPNSIKYQERRKKEIEKASKPISAIQGIVADYKKKAKKRGYEWALTLDDCSQLVIKDCAYCGSPPLIVYKTKHGSSILYNGIDRTDNNIGYTSENTVPCCKYCNFAKHKHSMEEFQAWLSDIAAYYPTLLTKELSKE